jgi:hypothetical protein
MADPVGGRVDAVWVLRLGVWGARSLALVLILALLFTMVNVQTFAASGQPVGSVQWWIAWLLDPMASITLGTAIVFEGLLAGYGRTVGWLTATKWYAGGCTWAMNIWVSMTSGSLAGVLLHSVAPGLVLLLAEAAPRVRRHMAEIVTELHQHQPGQSVKPPGTAHPAADLPPATYRRVEPVRSTGPFPAPPGRPEPVDTGAAGVPSLVLPVPGDTEPATNHTPITPAPAPVQVIPFPAQNPAADAPVTDDELDALVARMLGDAAAAGVRPPGRRAIAKALGSRASSDRVRRSLQRVGQPTRVLVLNGAGAGAGQQQVNGSGSR